MVFRPPNLDVEASLADQGARLVAGVDEVGRGAWAGPVTVGLVIIDDTTTAYPLGIRDSKMLSRVRREALVPRIQDWALAWGTGHATPGECDTLGMRGALAVASSRAIEACGLVPEAVICDGPLDLLSVSTLEVAALTRDHQWRRHPAPVVQPIVQGDQRCVTVAAASVLAKVARDLLMAELRVSEEFDFAHNAGYPAPKHLLALEAYGLTPHHRRSWSFAERYER